MLSARLHTTPCVSCGRSTPNRARRLEQPRSRTGRCTTTSDQNTPSRRGSAAAACRPRSTKPTTSPALAPSAVPRDQISPPKKAGATCAMAAKERRPIDGERRLARCAVIGVAEQDHDERSRRAARRARSRRDRPAAGAPRQARRRSTIGMTRWFEIMIATATDSTITMAVAAESPPRKAMRATMPAPSMQRQRQHRHVAVDRAAGESSRPRERDRDDEDVDEHEVEREQPGGALHVLDRRGSRPPSRGTGAAAAARRSSTAGSA